MMAVRRWVWAPLALVVVVAAVVAVVVWVRQPSPAAPTTEPAPTTTTVAPEPGDPVFAVKIDDVPPARPQTGLCTADVVYVEPVEGGVTRLLALYTGDRPEVVGPVRSARRSDIELLAQHGKPVFAYSGAAPELLPKLRAAALVDASEKAAPRSYYRDNARVIPHNLYLRPRNLPKTAEAPPQAALEFGPAPSAGASVGQHRSGGYTFRWTANRWAVSLSGSPVTSTECGPITAATVVEQRVRVTADEEIEDSTGHRSPVVTSVGTGAATVLRDGQRFTATWTRPDAKSPTRFQTADGAPLPLKAYPVWIVLIPD